MSEVTHLALMWMMLIPQLLLNYSLLLDTIIGVVEVKNLRCHVPRLKLIVTQNQRHGWHDGMVLVRA